MVETKSDKIILKIPEADNDWVVSQLLLLNHFFLGIV